jgi:plasmid stabilization system protein ParE
MAYSVRLMPRAADDVQRLYRTVIERAPLQGQEWFNRLIDGLYSLETFPERCKAIKGLSSPGRIVRLLLYGRRPQTYRIYFDVVETTVRILHIRHSARKEPRRL